MFSRFVSKLFGDKSKDTSCSDESKSPDKKGKHDYHTRSKGKKMTSSPEAKRRRNNETPYDINNSANVNPDVSKEGSYKSSITKSGRPSSPTSPDQIDAVLVNPPSPDVPVLVSGPAMSASIWENVGTPSTKEHVYEDCVVIETTEEHKTRMLNEVDHAECTEAKSLSEESFIKVDTATEEFGSNHDDKNDNFNTDFSNSFLDIDLPSNDNRRLTSSFLHIDIDMLNEGSNGVDKNVDPLETVPEKKELSIPKMKVNENSENQKLLSFEVVQVPSDLKGDNHTDVKSRDGSVKDTGDQHFNGGQDAQYVVPKIPVCMSKLSGKNEHSKRKDKQREKRKSKTPDKQQVKENIATSSKKTVFDEVKSQTAAISETEKDKHVGKKNIKENEKNSIEIKPSSVDRSNGKALQTSSTGPCHQKPIQKYIIPSRRSQNQSEEGQDETVKKNESMEDKSQQKNGSGKKDNTCDSTIERSKEMESKPKTSEVSKCQEVEAEPENFLEFVQRKNALGHIVNAKKLIFELGYLKDVPQKDIEAAVVEQYKIATRKKDHYWIKQARYNAELIFSQGWINENLPPLGGRKDKHADRKKKKQEKRQAGYSEYSNRSEDGMCRDVRLETNPNLQVVRENFGYKDNLEKPMEETEKIEKEDSEENSKQPKIKSADVTNPTLTGITENNQKEAIESTGPSKLTDYTGIQGRSSRMKYINVRLQTNPNMNIVTENASEKAKVKNEIEGHIQQSKQNDNQGQSRSSRMKYSDVRLETNPNLMVVRENAAEKKQDIKLLKGDQETVNEGDSKTVLKTKVDAFKKTVDSSKVQSSKNVVVSAKSESLSIESKSKICVMRPLEKQLYEETIQKDPMEEKVIENAIIVQDQTENSDILVEKHQPLTEVLKSFCDENGTKSSNIANLPKETKVASISYADALKSPRENGEKYEKNVEIDVETSEKTDSTESCIRKEVSGFLTSLLSLVETEYEKKYEKNTMNNGLTNTQNNSSCNGSVNVVINSIFDEKNFAETSEVVKSDDNVEIVVKGSENINGICATESDKRSSSEPKREVNPVIADVKVETQGEGFIVKTKIAERGFEAEEILTVQEKSESGKGNYLAKLNLVQKNTGVNINSNSDEISLTFDSHKNALVGKDLDGGQSKENINNIEQGTMIQSLQSYDQNGNPEVEPSKLNKAGPIVENNGTKDEENMDIIKAGQTFEEEALALTRSVHAIIADVAGMQIQTKLENDSVDISFATPDLMKVTKYDDAPCRCDERKDMLDEEVLSVGLSAKIDTESLLTASVQAIVEDQCIAQAQEELEKLAFEAESIDEMKLKKNVESVNIVNNLGIEKFEKQESSSVQNSISIDKTNEKGVDVESFTHVSQKVGENDIDDMKSESICQSDLGKRSNALLMDKKLNDEIGIDVQTSSEELNEQDIKSIEKDLKNIITEMVAKEKSVVLDNRSQNSSPTVEVLSSGEQGNSGRMSPNGSFFLHDERNTESSPELYAGQMSSDMVRSCEFLCKGCGLSGAESLESLSSKSDHGGPARSKIHKKPVGNSRTQKPKFQYSKSYESPYKQTFKDRNWQGSSTPGRYGYSRHDSCKQPTDNWHSYNSPRQFRPFTYEYRGQKSGGRGTPSGTPRGSHGNTPKSGYQRQNYETSDRNRFHSGNSKQQTYKGSPAVDKQAGRSDTKNRESTKPNKPNQSKNTKMQDKTFRSKHSDVKSCIEEVSYKVSATTDVEKSKKDGDLTRLSKDLRSSTSSQNHAANTHVKSGGQNISNKESDSIEKEKTATGHSHQSVETGDQMTAKSGSQQSKKVESNAKEQAQGTSISGSGHQKSKPKKKRRSNAKYKW